MANELTSKFVRAHYVSSTITAADSIRWIHKLIYEFWGFCINGTNNLIVPGGFAAGGVLFTPQWQSGTAVLMSSGSDGVTQAGMPFFTAPSVNWTSGSVVGKWLVTWKSGSTSTDDSVYAITQVINSSTIRVDVNNGGTPYSASLHPSFTARSDINFRVVDFAAATTLSGFTTDADGLVLQLNGAYLVNSGQVAPQCRTRIRIAAGSNLPNVGLTLSSSGSWTAATGSGFFSDASAEISATSNANGWGGGAASTGYVTLIGAQDYLLCHSRGWQTLTAGSGFHLEVPQRLYHQNNDPNPVCVMNFGNLGLTTNGTTNGYGGGVMMFHPPDGSTRAFSTMIRSLTGDYFNSTQYPSNRIGSVTNGRFNDMYFNQYKGKFMMFDATLGLPSVAKNYSYMRVRMRRVKFTAPITPNFQRFGDYGEWLNVGGAVLWPWDNAILPYSLFLGGL